MYNIKYAKVKQAKLPIVSKGHQGELLAINLLKPNDISICRTAALNSRRYILNIYLKNIRTEYFKHAA